MKLTGSLFLFLSIVFVPLSVGLLMSLWNRVGGPQPLRFASRLAMVLFTQATAITLVFVVVNNSNQLYGSWGDLLGTDSHVRAVPVPPVEEAVPNKVRPGAPEQPKVIQQFGPVDDNAVPKDVKTTTLTGRLSGVDGEVLVWTPPQYDDPAYKDKKFPVVELLAGFPGSSSAWFGSMKASKQLAPLMKSGQVAPFILVSPRVVLLPGHIDTGCADVPGKVNAETWLARDVPQMILDNFRAEPGPENWAVAGYSAGAHCAARLALAHPNRYHAGIGMSGYNDPNGQRDSLTAKDPHLREISNPLYTLTHAQTPPNVALYVTGQKGDGYEDALALQKAAKAPTSVSPVEVDGPHLTSTWTRLVPSAFTWLTRTIAAKTG